MVEYVIIVLATIHAGLLAIFTANVFYLRKTRNTISSATPRVSVLIPARNEESNLRRLLPTLLSQDYPDIEVVVVDDASDDDTWGVLSAIDDERLKAIRADGPPPGWVGKVHALYQATRSASGSVFLFLDADAEFLHDRALRNIVSCHANLPSDAVLTGVTRLRGGGQILVSMVTHAMLVSVPWFLIRHGPPSFGALNGQCWMISSQDYSRLEPHLELKGEILEDVRIGRYLARSGLVPTPVDVQQDLAIYMYTDIADAWAGFRKNAYLIMGGTFVSFLVSLIAYWGVYLIGPVLSWWLLGSLFLLKGLTDYRTGFRPWVTLLAPVGFVLGAIMQFDSAIAHWRRRVVWKDRTIRPSRRNMTPTGHNS
jgi:glycosyltransferase involved in cell wall biosynthesis